MNIHNLRIAFLKSTKNPINEMETSLIVFVDHSNAQAMIMYSKHNTNVNNASDK